MPKRIPDQHISVDAFYRSPAVALRLVEGGTCNVVIERGKRIVAVLTRPENVALDRDQAFMQKVRLEEHARALIAELPHEPDPK